MRSVRNIHALALICLSVSTAAAQTATSRIVSAANTFLSTLDEKQRQSVLFAFDDEATAQTLVESSYRRSFLGAASA